MSHHRFQRSLTGGMHVQDTTSSEKLAQKMADEADASVKAVQKAIGEKKTAVLDLLLKHVTTVA